MNVQWQWVTLPSKDLWPVQEIVVLTVKPEEPSNMQHWLAWVSQRESGLWVPFLTGKGKQRAVRRRKYIPQIFSPMFYKATREEAQTYAEALVLSPLERLAVLKEEEDS